MREQVSPGSAPRLPANCAPPQFKAPRETGLKETVRAKSRQKVGLEKRKGKWREEKRPKPALTGPQAHVAMRSPG